MQYNLFSIQSDINRRAFLFSFSFLGIYYSIYYMLSEYHLIFQIKTQNVDAWISSFGEQTKKQKMSISFEATLQCSPYDTIYSVDGVSVALRTITSVCSSNFHGLIKLLLTLCGAKKCLFPHLT